MPIRRTSFLVGSYLVATLLLGCNRDWDAYDPRLGETGPGAGGNSATSSGMGGQSSSSTASGTGGGGAGGAGGGSTCGVKLYNDFEDGKLDDMTWAAYTSMEVSAAETNGSLVFDLPSTSSQAVWGVLQSNATLDLSGCAVVVHAQEVPAALGDVYTHMKLSVGPDWLELGTFKGEILFKFVIDGVHYEEEMPPMYDPIPHAWWRIREEAGITYWDTSPDGKEWKNRRSASNPLKVEAMFVKLEIGTLTGVSEPLGRARFDDLRVGP
jgi:hypothetical protein